MVHIRSPYLRLMRLHQPTGIWLLLWPCWWAIALASPHFPDGQILALFALGAVIMRAAGCIINDMADRDFDRQVERTKTRPLASGEIGIAQAAALLAALLLAGLAIAVILGPAVIVWAVLSLFPVALYPFMKRISWWPQLFLGFTFNWGALMGWAAVKGIVEWPALALYAGGLFWTLGYDTIYAHQDKKDDARAGIKSTALRLGEKTKWAIACFYVAAITCWLASLLGSTPLPSTSSLAGLVAAGGHFAWQVRSLKIDDPASCRRIFKSNTVLGGIVFAAFLAKSL